MACLPSVAVNTNTGTKTPGLGVINVGTADVISGGNVEAASGSHRHGQTQSSSSSNVTQVSI